MTRRQFIWEKLDEVKVIKSILKEISPVLCSKRYIRLWLIFPLRSFHRLQVKRLMLQRVQIPKFFKLATFWCSRLFRASSTRLSVSSSPAIANRTKMELPFSYYPSDFCMIISSFRASAKERGVIKTKRAEGFVTCGNFVSNRRFPSQLILITRSTSARVGGRRSWQCLVFCRAWRLLQVRCLWFAFNLLWPH